MEVRRCWGSKGLLFHFHHHRPLFRIKPRLICRPAQRIPPGQGLALVREVIEAEMAGRALCEQSELGGARIVLRLPVGAKRNK